jgi:acetyl-CoA acyltransferase
MTARRAVIVDAVRTPFGRLGGALAGWHPVDLLATVLLTLLERLNLDPALIDDVIGGCLTPCGEQGVNVTRNAWVAAGLPWTVPATTVDRQCGSSQQAIQFAAAGVLAGYYDLVVACGVESMSRVRLGANAEGGLGPFSAAFLESVESRVWFQTRVAHELAVRHGVSREEMDEFAALSHRRAAAAMQEGFFQREMVAVEARPSDNTPRQKVLDHDEGVRGRLSSRALAALPPLQYWEPETAPTITAGNSSQTSDGASAMLIANADTAEGLSLPVRGVVTHNVVAADDAVYVLSAPLAATRKLLDRSGLAVNDFDSFEVNEAFAVIPLMWMREFNADPALVNPRGGAIAIGHPPGATGVRLAMTLLNQLEESKGHRGLQVICEGGGQANVTVLQRV